MDESPYGPWRLNTGESSEPSGPLDPFLALYEAAAERGISPVELDRCEVWQVAAALGATRADDAGPVAPSRSDDLIAARMRHAAGEGPKPEARASAGMETVMRTVGGDS